ncbi:Golgin subfamily A member 7B [Apodemus speciosus]|uniref:Golgin subfamily A member 7B n=1 Tax=Apodemus speciosus TaxID=105296 RepID=A0ABQ0FT62_APOSI
MATEYQASFKSEMGGVMMMRLLLSFFEEMGAREGQTCFESYIARDQVHNLQELRRSASLATKVFIQRDYSDGTICQFQTKFPPELDSRIERQLFEETVKTLNGFYAEAEKIGGSSYLEGCLACATAYFIFLCMETHYEKVLKKISRYIQEQNEKVFAPRGLLLTDPVERGMRDRDLHLRGPVQQR